MRASPARHPALPAFHCLHVVSLPIRRRSGRRCTALCRREAWPQCLQLCHVSCCTCCTAILQFWGEGRRKRHGCSTVCLLPGVRSWHIDGQWPGRPALPWLCGSGARACSSERTSCEPALGPRLAGATTRQGARQPARSAGQAHAHVAPLVGSASCQGCRRVPPCKARSDRRVLGSSSLLAQVAAAAGSAAFIHLARRAACFAPRPQQRHTSSRMRGGSPGDEAAAPRALCSGSRREAHKSVQV